MGNKKTLKCKFCNWKCPVANSNKNNCLAHHMRIKHQMNYKKEDETMGTIEELRSKQRAEFRRVINEMKCEVPTNKRISDPLSEENVNKAILYAGRFNYNKALDDLLLEIKE
jgi:hypothetical protein